MNLGHPGGKLQVQPSRVSVFALCSVHVQTPGVSAGLNLDIAIQQTRYYNLPPPFPFKPKSNTTQLEENIKILETIQHILIINVLK